MLPASSKKAARRHDEVKGIGATYTGSLGESGSNQPDSSPLIGEEMLTSSQTVKILGRYISFPPRLGRAIGIEETIFLMSILYASQIEGEWVCRDSEKLEDETGLTYKQQLRVRGRLKTLELIEEKSERIKHLQYFKVREDNYDKLIIFLGHSLALKSNSTGETEGRELTFGSNSTFPNGVLAPSQREVRSYKELKQEVREEEKSVPFSPVSKSVEEFEQEMESKRQRREEKKLNRERGFKIHTRKPFVEPPKKAKREAPKGWLIFAERYKSLFGMLPITGPERWDKLQKVHAELRTMDAVCERLEEWGESRGSVTAFSVDDFLSGEWKIVAA